MVDLEKDGIKLSVGQSGHVIGAWLNLPDFSCLTCYHCPDQGLVLGYYKNTMNGKIKGCDLALSISTDGLKLQYTDSKGDIQVMTLMGN